VSAAGIGSKATRAVPIRAGLGHPVIDADGHFLEAAFREFVCVNPIRFYTRTNPDFFAGTRVEQEAAAVVANER